jgi:hypothetical protein
MQMSSNLSINTKICCPNLKKNFFLMLVFVDTGGNLPPASLTPVANLPPVSLTPMANLPPVSTTLVKMVENFPPVSLIPVVHL